MAGRNAAFQMERRRLSEEIVREVLAAPQQRLSVLGGREVFQSQMTIGGRRYLVRVIVDLYKNPPEVVTVYRTSKISRYWRNQP